MLIRSTSWSPVAPLKAAYQGSPDRVELGRREEPVVPRLAEVLRRAGKPYYDEVRDRRDQQAYYGGFSDRLAPDKLFWELHGLLDRTHTHHTGYEPREKLFPWVDLRPNLRLQCIYDPRPVAVDAPVRGNPQDFEVKVPVQDPAPQPSFQSRRSRKNRKNRKNRGPRPGKVRYETRSIQEQAQQWARALAQAPGDALALAQKIADIETKQFLNCEHVVPKHWFGERQPMTGDLHHLFTANNKTNSDRSSRRLVDFPEYDGSDGKGYAPFDDERYEPAAGKGEVARATLYFLVRYPRAIGRDQGEIVAEDLKTLLEWHRMYPPTLHERHRNQAIQAVQGNRNPFIDHPEWADLIDFTQGIAKEPPVGGRRNHQPGWRPQNRDQQQRDWRTQQRQQQFSRRFR
ncbi:MAG: endonuclease, partial [Candidatus Eremiobacterota bacterium]